MARDQDIIVSRNNQRRRADVSKAFGAEDLIPVSWLVRADGSVQAKVSGIHSREWFEQQLLTMF